MGYGGGFSRLGRGLPIRVTLQLRNEEELLGGVEGNPEAFYLQVLQPYKLRGYVAYLVHRSAKADVKLLFATMTAVVNPSRAPAPSVEEIRAANRGFGF